MDSPSIYEEPVPPQPPESSWAFVGELRQPLHDGPIPWGRKTASAGEMDWRAGVVLETGFPDPNRLLETAYADFRRFLRLGGIPRRGKGRFVTARQADLEPEAYRIEVAAHACRLLAGDTEGIRRGLVHIENEMLRACGPFLARGRITRTPVIRTRLSRCFFGPIKRPPKHRDELLDDMDYYPEEYLNRLAHDGVNGVWLTVEWKDLVPTDLFPAAGQNAARRLDKLRRVVAHCARYGIRIYVFCIEPAALPPDSPAFAKHPELAGHRQSGLVYFCTSSPAGIAYVENSSHRLFDAVPGLGGMLVISVGECATHCYSAGSLANNCPRCSRRKPWEVWADTMAAMQRGMHAANPAAELITWPYSQYILWGPRDTIDAAGHLPPGVILQHNFESGARARQLGRMRTLCDYWLSYIGPSRIFKECAQRVAAGGGRISAKLQVGCSHETATTPFVPVPGNLYRKFRAMHRLGVSAAMYGWYFGTCPSLMTRAAGELAFAPLPRSEQAFLDHLARRDWGRHASRVAAAWRCFQESYRQFPYTHMAGYYGPFHDGPVWPLYLIPRDTPLAPTWQLTQGLSGDRIGEMIGYSHTAAEFQQLLKNMHRAWQRGLRLLAPLGKIFRNHADRRRDLGIAEALGIQFESAMNILDFYLRREELPYQTPARQSRALVTLRRILQREIKLSSRLSTLARADTRLGFHAEAEGYKYHPQLLQWRIRQLRWALKTEFPKVAADAARRAPVFPAHSGHRPEGPCYEAQRFRTPPRMNGHPDAPPWDDLPSETCRHVMSPHAAWVQPLEESEHRERITTWKAGYTDQHLYVGIVCHEPRIATMRVQSDETQHMPAPYWNHDCAGIMIEPRRLWPCQTLLANVAGARWQRWPSWQGEPWRVSTARRRMQWSLILRIPFRFLRPEAGAIRPLRIDILRAVPAPGVLHGERLIRWMHARPWPYRLALRRDNPADLGWLFLADGLVKRKSDP